MKKINPIMLALFLLPMNFFLETSHADNCKEWLSFSEKDRVMASLDVLTNASSVQKTVIAIMLSKACRGEIDDFSRSQANIDVGKLLPYLRSKSNHSHAKNILEPVDYDPFVNDSVSGEIQPKAVPGYILEPVDYDSANFAESLFKVDATGMF
ncbi:hypothetical protein [uncultured Desulfobacter sp.]|uniref:hypothetical protein n=1 Tax=uncultured Desulfobacter sp. TaxID=240139 RepID=UPI0029F5AC8E|nr:hypothetical protein [uncultured Desulfobacter sp.]